MKVVSTGGGRRRGDKWRRKRGKDKGNGLRKRNKERKRDDEEEL